MEALTTKTQSDKSLNSWLRPRYSVHQEVDESYLPIIEELAAAANVDLLTWQKNILKYAAAINDDGQFIHRRVVCSIPRQAGKTTMIVLYVIFLAMCLGAKVLWTAHNYSTTCKTLRDFQEILGIKPNNLTKGLEYFNQNLKSVSFKTAQEAFFFKPFVEGQQEGAIVFSTRTKTATLGSTFDILVADEAQEVTDEHLQAILPTTVSGKLKNPQYIYMGTPRRAGSPADKFERLRQEALNSPDKELCYFEYGLEQIGDTTDEKRWYEANPSLVEGITNVDAIRDLSHQLSPLAFAQECLGVWLDASELERQSHPAVIDAHLWSKCKTHEPPVSPSAYAVKFSVDGQYFAVCVACKTKGGIHVELVDKRPSLEGKRALIDFVISRSELTPFVIDGKAGAESLVERVSPHVSFGSVCIPKAQDLIKANDLFIDSIIEGTLTWYEPFESDGEMDELTHAVTSVYKRRIGTSGGWGFDGEGAAVVEAAALAVWKAQQANIEDIQEVYF